jgi:uncharacterized membrane protein (UPF0127 family)
VSAEGCKLVDRNTGRVVIHSLKLATTLWQRFCGWQFQSIPPAGHGLLLVPCNSVHTFAMRFPIDIVFLAPDGEVVSVRPHVVPWRIVAPVRGATAVAELPSGRCLVQAGQRLAITVDRAALAVPGLRAMTLATTGEAA